MIRVLLSVLLAGCAYQPMIWPEHLAEQDFTQPETMPICVVNPNEDVERWMAGKLAQYGIIAEFIPFPDRHRAWMTGSSHDDTLTLQRVIVPGCPVVLNYAPSVAMGIGCVLAVCVGGYTAFRFDKLDAVMTIIIPTKGVVEHETYHVMGCTIGEQGKPESGPECLEKIQRTRMLLKEKSTEMFVEDS